MLHTVLFKGCRLHLLGVLRHTKSVLALVCSFFPQIAEVYSTEPKVFNCNCNLLHDTRCVALTVYQ